MNGTKVRNEYGILLRACEGLPLLVLAVVFLALSWLLKREPLF